MIVDGSLVSVSIKEGKLKMKTLEEEYGLRTQVVKLERRRLSNGKVLEVFENTPDGEYIVEVTFPEFTCLCPKTSQPDFAEVLIAYIPDTVCVELKSLKYFLNSFRNEGHFHEEVTNQIHSSLCEVLSPFKLYVEGRFNVRGGTYPIIRVGNQDLGRKRSTPGAIDW